MAAPSFCASDLVALRPKLRAFAISLTRNAARADDLVQEAMLRAITHASKFEPGTNLQAWMFTILRNFHRTEWRRCRREIEDVEGKLAGSAKFSVGGEDAAISRLDYAKVCQCMLHLPPDYREALELVAVEGFSYEEAAAAMGCAVGTVKSRVNRGRMALTSMLEGYQLRWVAEDPGAAEAWGRIVGAGALDDLAWGE